MWTQFFDMHSGGLQKTKYEHIYINASKTQAIEMFKNYFALDPTASACQCCGEDFSIYEDETLEGITEGMLGAMTLQDYLNYEKVLFIFNTDAKEKHGNG